jgi:hypothetical protein
MNTDALAIPTTTQAGAGLLRFALTLDGVVTGAMGLAFAAGTAVLDGWLGLPAGLIVGVGAFLTAYAALVLRLATREPLPRPAVIAVIEANALWTVGSLLALALDWHEPSTAGQVIIAVQAVGTAAFAALQYVALRRV